MSAAATTVTPDNWIYLQKGWFDQFRNGFFPTLYPANPTPVEADIVQSGFIYAAVILGFSLLIILPGIRSTHRLSTFIRIIIGVFVVVSIMICNFGQEWEVAQITTRTQYRAGLSQQINASISVLIGLRSVNITLQVQGAPNYVQEFTAAKVNETINYNERLSWDNAGWTVGRAGFGPYAGRYNQEYREHQRKGSPYPILWIAEYFTLDGEGARWGRHYLQAGYYTHIVLWTALPLWLLSMILFKMVVAYGAYFAMFTSFCLFTGNVIFDTQRNAFPLEIPFEDGILKFSYGWSFWLCIFTGFLTGIIGGVIALLDILKPDTMSDFFGLDIFQGLEEVYADDPAELNDEVEGRGKFTSRRFRKPTIVLRKQGISGPSTGETNFAFSAASLNDDSQGVSPGDIELNPTPAQQRQYQRQLSPTGQGELQRGYRRKTMFPASFKSQKQNPRPTAPPLSPRSPRSPRIEDQSEADA